ncbi:DMT family transporter [Pseudoalteromonas sp. NBT06-2]|uniref:DMT family transporter n=1 Tax=Pseudoalteromonas sp. NBT06-2 TaxID=2025950 RepID=UPI002074FB12|nr:DMT family transporter [Pseudoalteromonas sp. NBT06-2]
MYAVTWMVGALLSFSLMAVCARELAGEVATYQILFFRSAIGLIFVSIILITSKKHINIKTKRLSLHTLRNIFHFAGQYGWFLGIAMLPLAEVFALEFTVPIWTLIIAATALGEKVTIRKIVSVLLGSLGVVIVLQPGISIIDTASFIVLASAIFYAVSHTATKSLSASDSAISILFYMCLIQLPIGLFFSITDWVWPIDMQWLWLLVIGLTALTAHYCMAKAMEYAEVTTVVTLDFLRLPLVALIGVLLYSEKPEFALLIGGLLMLVGNIVSLKQPADNTYESDHSK